MSHIRHYWVLPWATVLLTLLENIAEVPDWWVAKMGKSSIFWLSSSSSSLTVSQASTIMAEAITMIRTWNNNINDQVLHSLLIVIVELELFFSDSQALRSYMLNVLYAILGPKGCSYPLLGGSWGWKDVLPYLLLGGPSDQKGVLPYPLLETKRASSKASSHTCYWHPLLAEPWERKGSFLCVLPY